MLDIKLLCLNAKREALRLQTFSTIKKNELISLMADALLKHQDEIIKANAIDMENAKANGKDASFLDRLALNQSRILQMAEGLRQIIDLDDPIGEITESWETSKNLKISKVRVPIGVIAIIYEARPNVTADAIGLCIKSGNAVILKGSKDAINSNLKITEIMQDALRDKGNCRDLIAFINDISRESTLELLKCGEYVDLAIPRGGNALKEYVLNNANMPVIASAGGNCHIYIEKTADLDMAVSITHNAKCSRPSTCNAVEQLLIDECIADTFIPAICDKLEKSGVKILGDDKVCSLYNKATPANDDDYYTEHSALVLSIKCVSDYNQAINWINEHNTLHSEAIISNDEHAVQSFFKGVDAAALYHNASTRFTDGFEFGFGAEMGISTQKLHVRGPIGLKALTIEKYLVTGDGTIRE